MTYVLPQVQGISYHPACNLGNSSKSITNARLNQSPRHCRGCGSCREISRSTKIFQDSTGAEGALFILWNCVMTALPIGKQKHHVSYLYHTQTHAEPTCRSRRYLTLDFPFIYSSSFRKKAGLVLISLPTSRGMCKRVARIECS